MAKSMAYDHPAYQVRHVRGVPIAAGASTTGRFQAHADLLAVRGYAMPSKAGTSADETVIIYKVATSGGATTALGTITLGASASITGAQVDLADASIAQGDEVRFLSGTDATMIIDAALEYQIKPGADLND